MIKLGVNIDHIATLRNARGGEFPSPVHAAFAALEAGASNVTCHLREDRRHIRDEDVRLISRLTKRLNLEMAANEDIVDIAIEISPRSATIVPERRQELTTEGGLNVFSDIERYKKINKRLRSKKVAVSAFIEPEERQIKAAKDAQFNFIEIHTGRYAGMIDQKGIGSELLKIKASVRYALDLGLGVNAGHGLNYENTYDIARIGGIYELNIGYSIITHSIFVGLHKAVKEMIKIIGRAELPVK